jgi:two-component system phosphate regulon response regulator OmpR
MSIFDFDLIILDIMMPKERGTDFLLRLQKKHPPIIMLTAMADVDDRINGLELGAEDYLAKPFEVKELLLRMKNLINRRVLESTKNFGAYSFDINKMTLTKDSHLVHLTTTEANLLKVLIQSSGNIITREEIISSSAVTINERAVDAQIARLRTKIEDNPKNPLYLHTIRNKGYIFRI